MTRHCGENTAGCISLHPRPATEHDYAQEESARAATERSPHATIQRIPPASDTQRTDRPMELIL